MLKSPPARAAEANGAYSNRDTLHTNELSSGNIPLDLQTKLDGFSNACHQLIERARLGMTASQFWNARDVIPFLIAFNNDTKLALF